MNNEDNTVNVCLLAKAPAKKSTPNKTSSMCTIYPRPLNEKVRNFQNDVI